MTEESTLTTFDPFAPAPAAAPEPVAAPAPATVTTVAAPTVAAGSDGKIVVTLKGGAGFDSPWIVMHCSTIAEADALLSADSGIIALMEKVKNGAAYFSGGSSTAAAPAAAAPTSAVPAGAQAPERPANVPADFVFKSGVSQKNGRTWKAWMPPTKGDPRDAIWV